jgi:hypothetical protein
VSESDAPAELRREFWVQVVIFNAAVLALAAGLMLVAFTTRRVEAAVLVAAGLGFFAHGMRRYRAFTTEDKG